MLSIFKEEVRRGLGDGSLSKKERIDTYMEMGEIIAEETGWKLASFDPSLAFRDDNWNYVQMGLEFAIPLVKALIELRVLRETIEELRKEEI